MSSADDAEHTISVWEEVWKGFLPKFFVIHGQRFSGCVHFEPWCLRTCGQWVVAFCFRDLLTKRLKSTLKVFRGDMFQCGLNVVKTSVCIIRESVFLQLLLQSFYLEGQLFYCPVHVKIRCICVVGGDVQV